MNFELNSLHLGTDFDEPIEPLRIPAVAGKGREPALVILDGANRAPHRLSRAVRRVALLGLKVANPEGGVRVSVTLLADSISTNMWNRVHSPSEEEPVLEEEFPYHRLVEVSAQGRSRGVIVLAARRGDEKGVRQRLQFDLPATEIGKAGLVMIGLEEPSCVPGWASERLLEDSVVGLCVVNVKLEPLDDEDILPTVSGGKPKQRVNASHPGFFVVNRGTGTTPVKVVMTPLSGGARGGAREGRWERLRRPVRDLRARRSPLPARVPDSVEFEAVSSSGQAILRTSVARDQDGTFSVVLPGGEEPAFVRLQPANGRNSPVWNVGLEQVP